MAKSRGRLGPYSRVLQRGVIADTVDGRSREGRLMRAMEAELVRHVGGSPSIVAKLLIERTVKIRMQIDGLEEKLARGDWTPHDSRTYGGLLNAYRLCCREIGLKGTAPKPATLADHLAKRAAERQAPPEDTAA
jgi:hypothetical protein